MRSAQSILCVALAFAICAAFAAGCGERSSFPDAGADHASPPDTLQRADVAPGEDAGTDGAIDATDVEVARDAPQDQPPTIDVAPPPDTPRTDSATLDSIRADAPVDALRDATADGPCGRAGEPCCAGMRCAAELTCNPITSTCGTCGGFGQRCCAGACFISGTMCDFGDECSTRGACGYAGMACCEPGGSCRVGSTCFASTCVTCGASGQTCCAVSSCNSGLACDSGGRCR